MSESAILLVSCPDQRGLVAALADFLARHGGNILHNDQHQDAERRLFLTRMQWSLQDFDLDMGAFAHAFAPLAERFRMQWRLASSGHRPRTALFVSRYDHCLIDLLYRYRSGELACDMVAIVSNHEDAADIAAFHGVPFFHIAVDRQHRAASEARQLELLRELNVELVVLARYMQILSAEFVAAYPQRIINIHHSFLPAFTGARPYHRAHQRGVKLIGATSHYVTEVLDDGPIIEQDVARVSHRDDVEDLIQKGRDLEKVVLSRAVRWHVESRILVYDNRTVVFD